MGKRRRAKARGFSPDRTPYKLFKAYISAGAEKGNTYVPGPIEDFFSLKFPLSSVNSSNKHEKL
jgi:hypothetical protein